MTDTELIPTPERPTPARIDAIVRKIERYTELQKPTPKQQEAAKKVSSLRAEALALCQQFGETPKNAPCSVRLAGKAYVLTVTSGTITRDNQPVVVEFLEAAQRHGQTALFATMFTPSTTYNRAKDASNNLRTADLPKKARKELEDLFTRTSTESQRAPVLKIDLTKIQTCSAL